MIRINAACFILSGLLLCAGCGGVEVPGDATGGAKDAGGKADAASSTDGGADSTECTEEFAEGLAVAESDVYGGPPFALGYPPYAVDGCRLLYVVNGAVSGSVGELRLRDLATGEDTALEGAASKPRRPAARGGWMAWEATLNGVDVVRVTAGKEILTLEGPFDHAGEPRASADAVVFTGWLGPGSFADTDVFLFEPGTGAMTSVGKGSGQQRFPDVSLTHVAWADFSEDPDGTFNQSGEDAADIVLFTRESGAITPRKRVGKQAFPLLGATGRLVYLDWGEVHPEPKFSEYDLRIGDLGAAIEADVTVDHVTTQKPYIRPAALDGWIEWVRWPFDGNAELLRRPADLSKPAVVLPVLGGLELFTPIASKAMTLVGARAPGKQLTLAAFAR
jgi:hypothetical protein